MGELRPVLERLRDGFSPPPDGFERLVVLRSRKRRRQRLSAATVALALGIGGVVVAGRAFDVGSGHPKVGEPSELIPQLTFIRDGELWSIGPDGIGEARLALQVPGHVNGVAWSPDGGRLAVSVQVDSGSPVSEFHLFVMNADASESKRLTDGVSDRFPAWSPDGSRIAFTRDLGNGHQEIFVIGADGGGETRLTDTDGANLQPTWSPDGSRIAFSSMRDGGGNTEIYVMNADGSEPRRLTNDPGRDAEPVWSSSGLIAYTSDGLDSGVHVIDPEVGAPELLLADPDPANLFVSWSPDGRFLALASRRDGDPALFALDVQTGELSRLAEGGVLWGPAWRLAPSAEEPVEPSPSETSPVRGEVAATFPVGEDVRSVVYGEGSVWVAVSNNDGSFGGRILRVDPATNDPIATIDVETIPTWEVGGGAMVVADGSLWLTGGLERPGAFDDPGGGADAAVIRIDASTNEVVQTFELGGEVGADLTFLDGDLWVLLFGDETVDHSMEVVRVEPSTGDELARIPLTTGWAHRIVPVGARLIVIEGGDPVVNEGGQMTSIDPVTNAVAANAAIPSRYSPHGPVEWHDELWASLEEGFARFDPATGELVGRSTDLDQSRLAIGVGLIEADDRGIWFFGYDGMQGDGPRRLARFDPGTETVTELVSLEEGNPIAMAIGPDSVWILNNEGTLTRVDLIEG